MGISFALGAAMDFLLLNKVKYNYYYKIKLGLVGVSASLGYCIISIYIIIDKYIVAGIN
jgi:hypothetical protein